MHTRTQLKSHGLKDTLTRRAVLRTFEKANRPLAVTDVHRLLHKRDQPVNIVTIYRIVDILKRTGFLHEHSSEEFSFCKLAGVPGHHILLRCVSCGKVKESSDSQLCKREDAIARREGFRSVVHSGELLGTCSQCRS